MINNFLNMDAQERKNKAKRMFKKQEVYDNVLRNLIILEGVFAEREDCIDTLAIKKSQYDIEILHQYIGFDVQENKREFSWVKEVMAWLGQSYEKLSAEAYFNYQSPDEILSELKDYVIRISSKECWLNKDEQNDFKQRITNFAVKLKWGKLRENNDILGKNMIEKFFEEKNIKYLIVSESKKNQGTCWYIKKMND